MVVVNQQKYVCNLRIPQSWTICNSDCSFHQFQNVLLSVLTAVFFLNFHFLSYDHAASSTN
jgi:hypothetical protein